MSIYICFVSHVAPHSFCWHWVAMWFKFVRTQSTPSIDWYLYGAGMYSRISLTLVWTLQGGCRHQKNLVPGGTDEWFPGHWEPRPEDHHIAKGVPNQKMYIVAERESSAVRQTKETYIIYYYLLDNNRFYTCPSFDRLHCFHAGFLPGRHHSMTSNRGTSTR